MMTDPALRMLVKLGRNNALANYRLAQAVIGLDQSEFTARRVSFFPSLMATLNHILVIDWFYIDALEGGTLGPTAWENEESFDTARALYAAQRQCDERLVAFCDGLKTADLARPIAIHRQSRIQTERCDDVLNHLFAHHRGQVHAMLARTSGAPPQLDEFIVSDDAKFRSGELAAFGWTEADLGF